MQFVAPIAVLLPTALCAGMAVGQEGLQVIAGNGVAVAVPSGQHVLLHDVVLNAPGADGSVTRFRFVAPAITEAVEFDTAAADMAFLCESFALPRLSGLGSAPEQVVISLSDRAVAFGDTAPDAVQFFESYRIENGKCLWEVF